MNWHQIKLAIWDGFGDFFEFFLDVVAALLPGDD